jgi:predicted Zn finger-like uncharacterized protein
MTTVVTCPECDTSLKLPAEPVSGKKVKCPKCEAVFVPEDAESRRMSAERPVAPARPRRRPADDEDDDDPTERRPRRAKKTQGGGGLMIGLLVGGGVLVLLLLTCGGVGLFGYLMLRKASPPQQPVAKNVQANNPAPPAAVNNPPPAAAAGNNPPPADPPMPGPAVPPANPPMPGPGGNQPGNNQHQVELSNATVSRLGARTTISVDYKFVKGGPQIGMHLFVIIKPARGNPGEAEFFGPQVGNAGTFNLRSITFRGAEQGPYEIYVETGFPGPFSQRQRISNTVTTK